MSCGVKLSLILFGCHQVVRKAGAIWRVVYNEKVIVSRTIKLVAYLGIQNKIFCDELELLYTNALESVSQNMLIMS